MPSLCAHNKYGKLVIPKLSIEAKKTIRKYPNSFRIGLQGPDFLFFYKALSKNKINQVGVFYHHHDIYDFMEHAASVIKKYGKDSSQYSYILGYICHLALDSKCHPYVNKFMKDTGCGHVEIEGNLDYLILNHSGKFPEKYETYKLVPTDMNTVLSMDSFYEGLDSETIRISLMWMRFAKRAFVAPGFVERNLIDAAFHLTFHYDKLHGHVIQPYANKKCHLQTKFLYKLLKKSPNIAIDLINEFDNAVNGETLSDKFHIDFNGNNY